MPELASPRARLAWANGNIEDAARIIAAEEIREWANAIEIHDSLPREELVRIMRANANTLDPQ